MKKIIFAMNLTIFSLFLVSAQDNEIENFKIQNDQVIWQKIYDDSIAIKSQDIKLKAIGLPVMTTSFFISDITGAKLKVQHKKGSTRLTVSNIYSISSVKLDLGDVEENITPDYAEDFYVKKGKFKNRFIKKDAELINDIILRSIKSIIDSEKNDDW